MYARGWVTGETSGKITAKSDLSNKVHLGQHNIVLRPGNEIAFLSYTLPFYFLFHRRTGILRSSDSTNISIATGFFRFISITFGRFFL